MKKGDHESIHWARDKFVQSHFVFNYVNYFQWRGCWFARFFFSCVHYIAWVQIKKKKNQRRKRKKWMMRSRSCVPLGPVHNSQFTIWIYNTYTRTYLPAARIRRPHLEYKPFKGRTMRMFFIRPLKTHLYSNNLRFVLMQLVPVRVIWAVKGRDVDLPCDITTTTPGDYPKLILWFKDSVGIPLYRYDCL